MSAAWVEDLRIEVVASGAAILNGIDLRVDRGEIVGIAGETGSGKSTIGLALLGYHSPALRVAAGSVRVSGRDLATLGTGELRALRGHRVAYVPQDPASALSPGLTLRGAFAQVLRAHGVRDRAEQRTRTAQALDEVFLPSTPEFLGRYPHQLSGGQVQRAAIAIAFLFNPELVVMDEPTTGLDVATERTIVGLAQRLSATHGAGVVFVSHDLPLLLSFAHRIVVLRDGAVVEELPAACFLTAATHPYTRALIASLGHSRPADGAAPGSPLLQVTDLSARHGHSTVTHGINLEVAEGDCLALVGESGSGKTTTARAIAGLHADYDGTVAIDGQVMVHAVSRRTLEQLRAVQYVFQNPYSSFQPRRRVGSSIALVARQLRGLGRAEAAVVAAQMLVRVGLRPDHAHALPHQLSGGQRQRAALARALAADPRILVCDEVTSSLDASVRQEIVTLLRGLQASGLTMVFITHDLRLARSLAQSVVVLRDGYAVETGPIERVFAHPAHAYTRSLIDAAQFEGREGPAADQPSNP
jgi:peptide/nickel transport system ATP-binding protein